MKNNGPIKVCVIADPIDEQYAGIYTYAKGLIDAFEKLGDKRFEITYLHIDENEYFKGMRELIVPLKRNIPGNATFRKFFWIPYLLKKHGFDVVHDLSHIAPFPRKNTSYKKVFTVHDLTPVLFPQWHIKNSVVVHRILFPWLFKRVDGVIAVSESTKSDIQNTYPFAPEPKVTHLATKESPRPFNIPMIKKPYILSVSTVEPRKNYERLIGAYEQLVGKGIKEDLVIVGKQGWKCEEVVKRIEESNVRDRIHWTHFVGERELATWYAFANVFVYPSLYEGFGLPLLEAMQRGLPVVTSNVSSMPDVVGDAGLLVDPYDVDSIANALYTMLSDDKLHDEYGRKSLARFAHFSWEKTARETLDIYETLFTT